jgi:hypothetical protein
MRGGQRFDDPRQNPYCDGSKSASVRHTFVRTFESLYSSTSGGSSSVSSGQPKRSE